MSEPSHWGVQDSYEDASGGLRTAPRETVERAVAVLSAGEARAADGPLVAVAGARQEIDAVEIATEDGRTLACDGIIPHDLPSGYHQLVDTTGARRLLIVTPRRCTLPGPAPSFGFAAQLYAARSRRSWGIGDMSDLRTIAAWSASLGASVLLINPLHAPLPGLPQRASPYSPSSRRYRNPLYIDIDAVPGIDRIAADVDSLRSQANALLTDRHIDRDSVYRLKMAALERLWSLVRDVAGLDLFIAADPGVLRYATFCALVERHGAVWRRWPEEVRKPTAAGVERFRRGNERRVRFHVWLQWLLDRQLADAAKLNGLVHDLAVGFDPDGADAWEWQDLTAGGFDIGAPPDEFTRGGQNWALSPFDPWRLRAAGYRPFIETVRAGMRHASGLRIDHVMGLFRLFWIPDGVRPQDGVYVRYPSSDLLDILAVESARARAFVVGEDLGTVESSVREELTARDILSYRLLWFEEVDPADYPVKSLCGVTTHDLPTVAGMWDGSDLQLQRALEMHPNVGATETIARRVREATGLDTGAPIETVVEAVYALLARSPSLVRTATLDDMLAVKERPNLPGTDDQWPNWSLALPQSIEELTAAPLPARVARALTRA